jgi:hypothetical protein
MGPPDLIGGSRESAERALFAIDKSGGDPYIDVHDVNRDSNEFA